MAISVVKGYTLRATKVNSCGLPIPGAANTLVTDGFISFQTEPNMKDRTELTQENAAGKECVSDSTPPERRWWNIEAQLCGVDPDLWAMVLAWARILDPDGKPIGVRDRKSVDDQTGVMFELWTGGSSDDDCPLPTNDSIFSAAATGKNYGYFAIAGTEFTAPTFRAAAEVTTFTLTGRSIEPKQWGRGAFNVANIAAAGQPVEAGRLLVPMYDEDDENHFVFFRTPIAPPELTDGGVPLDIETTFVDPDFYFGGPADEPAADVAPDQPAPVSP